MASDAPPLAVTLALARIRALAEHPAVRALARAAAPQRVLLVGGAPRDAALGRPVGDLDAVVERDGERVAGRLAAALGGRAIRLAPGRFAALRVAAPELEVDLWDLEGGSLQNDLARRDLTVNALALDPGSGRVIDPHGGLADLTAGRLRAVRTTTFAADPLRVLRLARLALSLDGFAIEPGTERAARGAAPGLDLVAGERIRDELVQLATAARPAEEQRLLERVGAFPGLWDDFASPSSANAAAIFERYEAARAALGGAHALAGELAVRHALRLRAAASRRPPQERLERLATRAILTRIEGRAAGRLLEIDSAAPPRGDERLLTLARWGALWQVALSAAAAEAPAPLRDEWRAYLAEARAAVAERGAELLSPRPILDGAEVRKLLALEEGPAVGRALATLVEAQVLGRIATAEDARRLLAPGARPGAEAKSSREEKART